MASRAGTKAPRREPTKLEDIPNVGPSIARDLRRLGIMAGPDLVGRDPWALYREFCELTRTRQDPCLLDTFISAVRYMEGAPARPWWKYTAERKREWHRRME